jgi:hypothetical protein
MSGFHDFSADPGGFLESVLTWAMEESWADCYAENEPDIMLLHGIAAGSAGADAPACESSSWTGDSALGLQARSAHSFAC